MHHFCCFFVLKLKLATTEERKKREREKTKTKTKKHLIKMNHRLVKILIKLNKICYTYSSLYFSR
jgi:hypothetical protein